MGLLLSFSEDLGIVHVSDILETQIHKVTSLLYPRITMLRRLRDEKILSTDDIKSWTGIKAGRTIEGYGLRSQEGIHKVAAALMKE